MHNSFLKNKRLIPENHKFSVKIAVLTQVINQMMKITKKILMKWNLKILNKHLIIRINKVNI